MRLLAIIAATYFSFATASAATLGAYTTQTAPDAVGCIKLCNDDSLCVGSTFTNHACGLWAGVPAEAPSAFTLSDHAPAFARERATPAPITMEMPRQRTSPAPTSEALLGGETTGSDLRPRLGDGG